MDREKFTAALKQVRPALGRGDLLPQLAHLWFDGERVLAFDDNIGISAPCPTDFVGGINGDKLTRTIERAIGESVEVKLVKQAASFKVGRTSLKIGVMDAASQQFTMPKRAPKSVLTVNPKELRFQLKFAMQSVGHDVTNPEWCGITFEVDGENLQIYSGHSQVLSRATVPFEGKPKFARVVLHEKFCQQILNYDDAVVELHDGHGLLYDEETGVTIFGRGISGASSIDLNAILQAALDRAEAFVKLPRIDRMLDRASIFEGDHLNLRLAVVSEGKASRLYMTSESNDGKLVDFSKPLEGDHPEIAVMTNAQHLRSGAQLYEIAIGKDDIIIRDDDAVLMVSVAPAT